MDLTFTSTVIEWRGPAPYYYLPLTEEAAEDVHDVRKMATYGWGVIPVVARIGDVEFETSLFPRDGGYLLPLKDAVRKPRGHHRRRRAQRGDDRPLLERADPPSTCGSRHSASGALSGRAGASLG